MFAGQYYCKVDEKGRFVLPSPIREKIEATGNTLMFLKGQDLPVLAYTNPEWENRLKKAEELLDEDQRRLFMYHMVSEASPSEMDRAGRMLIPGRLRKLIPVDDEQEIVLVGMFHRLEIWNPSEWRLYVRQNEETYESHMGKIQGIFL
ncbi:MAG: division/cell wall cluster transcriptional repressor MraZ [Nitrospirales bacterium]